MTNQEAIMRIKEHIRIHQICEPKAIKISEALDMAISALEAQELSNNSPKLDSGNGELTDGDLVSRKDVIDEIDEWIKDCTDSNHYQSASDLRLVRKCIEGL